MKIRDEAGGEIDAPELTLPFDTFRSSMNNGAEAMLEFGEAAKSYDRKGMQQAAQKARDAIRLLAPAAEQLRDGLVRYGVPPEHRTAFVEQAANMREAIEKAGLLADEGDFVQ